MGISVKTAVMHERMGEVGRRLGPYRGRDEKVGIFQSRTHPARGSRTWSRVLLGVGLFILMGLGAMGGVLFHHHPRVEAGADRTITVQEGDTLWDIASRYAGADVDVREWIYQLRQMNHLSGESVLYPGMILHLPSAQ